MASTVILSIQECKSVVTTPSGGQVLLDKGFTTSRLAWSGRRQGQACRRVGGRRPQLAHRALEGPVQTKALTRFNLDWVWDGKPAIIQSRAMDETGYVQPQLQAAACRAWHAFDLSQQCHSVVAGAGKR